jgi:lipoprotein-anchoring transpeptidase ErfK/SrfK
VTVGGVSVGGLLPTEASTAVKKAYARPLPLVVSDTRTIRLAAGALGARPNFPKAILRARKARPGAIVPLDVAVSVDRIRTYVERLGEDLDRDPADARIVLRGVRPRAVPAHEGRHLKLLPNSRAIRFALKRNTRTAIPLAWDVRKPKVLSVRYVGAVVILRSSNRLLYYDKAGHVRRFGVATGQAAYPTPLGDYEVVNMQRNPWWYPPPSPWAAESDPVPPGPGNPLGTRWMGLSAPYVGIHGTPDAASIGYSASHGCIRMRIPDAEWLFRHVEIGMPVFIVAR